MGISPDERELSRRSSAGPESERDDRQRQSHSSRKDKDRRRRGSSAEEKDGYRASRSGARSRRSPDEDHGGRRRRDSRERPRDKRSHRTRSLSREDPDKRDRKSRRYDDDRHATRRRHHSRSRSPRRKPTTRSRSPPAKPTRDKSPPPRRARGPLPSQQDTFQQGGDAEAAEPAVEKQKPNFNSTGLLAKEANTVQGTNTVLKYHEPAEARKPSAREQWRMFVFKQKDMIDTIHLYSRSCWLMGRDQQVVDLLLEHPSISKQHAVIQFRHITKTNEFGDKQGKVKPYLIDLDSANGTRLNGSRIEPSRYVELRDADVVGFGESEREYVMMLPPR